MSLETLARNNCPNHEFTTKNKYLYSDNSMKKRIQQEKTNNGVKFSLSKRNSKILGQLQLSRLLEEEKREYKKLISRLRLSSNQINAVDRYVEEAAAVIQKYVRGWLTRKNMHEARCSHAQQMIHSQLDEMFKEITTQWLKSDKLTNAVKVIERHVKSWFIYKKILRLQYAYKLVKEESQGIAKQKVQEFLLKMVHIERLRAIKSELYRNKKLVEIKRNIAILAIKKHFNKNKLSIAKITLMYRRLRRASSRARKNLSAKNTPSPALRKVKTFDSPCDLPLPQPLSLIHI